MLNYILFAVICILIIIIIWKFYSGEDPQQKILSDKQNAIDSIKECEESKGDLVLEQAQRKAEILTKNKEIASLSEEKTLALEQIDSLKSTLSQLEAANISNADKNTTVEIQELKRNNANLIEKIQLLDKKIATIISERDQLLIDIVKLNDNTKILSTKIVELQAKIVKSDDDILKLTGQNTRLTTEVGDLKDDKKNIQTDNNTLRDEQNRLKGQIANLEIQRDAASTKIMDYAESSEDEISKVGELESQINKIDEQLKILNAGLRDLDFIIVDMGCAVASTSVSTITPESCWQKCKETVCNFASYNNNSKRCNISTEYPSNCVFNEGNSTYIKT